MSEQNTRRRGGARLQKNEKEPSQRSLLIRRRILIALAAVLVALLALFIAFRSWATRPDLPPPPQPSDSVQDTHEEEPLSDRKTDFYTFLVVGRDTGGGGNTDTILLAAYDIPNQKLNVMSIPRDTMVNIPYEIKRINGVYNYYGKGEEGIQALYNEVSQLVGFVPDFEIVVEWKAVGELVNAIDGVWFNVPRDMNYDDPMQNLHIHLSKGEQRLDGEDAMGLVRWRQNNDGTGYVTGDIGRIETQQAFLKEVIKQCLQIKNVTRIQELAQVFTDNVQTDLTLGNLAWFAEQAIFGGLEMEHVNFITLPGDYNGTAWSPSFQNYQSYVLPDAQQLLAVVNEHFNPYREDRAAQQLDIMSVNADGSLSSSTGVVEDKVAAKPPVIPKPEPEPEPTDEPEPEPTDEPEPTPEPELPEPPEQGEQSGDTEPPEQGGETQPEPVPEPTPTPEPEPTPWTPSPDVVAP